MTNPCVEILLLLSLTTVHSEQCPLSGYHEMQICPTPPEFPDFMAAFKGTILRIGITNLLQNDGLTLSKTCPDSVNWSEFNARLCGNDPFDLEGFCNPTTTVEATVASLTTPQIAEVRSISIETTTGNLVEIPPIDPGINMTPSTTIRTSRSPDLSPENETDSSTPWTSEPPDHKDNEDHGFKDNGFKNHDPQDYISKDPDSEDHGTKKLDNEDQGFKNHDPQDHISKDPDSEDHGTKKLDNEDHGFKNHDPQDHISNDPDSEDHGTKKLGSDDPVLPPDSYPVSGTKGLAEKLYYVQGSGASIAMDDGCGLTLIFIVIIIIVISHTG